MFEFLARGQSKTIITVELFVIPSFEIDQFSYRVDDARKITAEGLYKISGNDNSQLWRNEDHCWIGCG